MPRAPGPPPRSQGQWPVTACVSGTPLTKGCQTWWWIGARSSLLFPCFFSSPSFCSTWLFGRGNVVRGITPCGYARGGLNGTSSGPTKYGLIRERQDFLFKLSRPSHEQRALFLRVIDLMPSALVISMPKGAPAPRRFVWCTSRHVTVCPSESLSPQPLCRSLGCSVVRH
jgi:hypothetical protein